MNIKSLILLYPRVSRHISVRHVVITKEKYAFISFAKVRNASVGFVCALHSSSI